jgi:hypothetical protein
MSDSAEKKPFEGKFFTSIRPYLSFVDSSRFFTLPFSWLYILFAIVFLISPFVLLPNIIDYISAIVEAKAALLEAGIAASDFADYLPPGSIIPGAVLTWIAALVAAWLGFQIWLNRKETSNATKLTPTVIIGAFEHLIYTAIEASATYLGVAGFFTGLFAVLLQGGLLSILEIDQVGGLIILLGSLAVGYFGVWLAKLAAFLFRKIAEIVVYVVIRIFNFFVHIIKQLFEHGFTFAQSVVDFIVNGWKVVIALVAKWGNTLLAIAHAPINSNKASISYND